MKRTVGPLTVVGVGPQCHMSNLRNENVELSGLALCSLGLQACGPGPIAGM